MDEYNAVPVQAQLSVYVKVDETTYVLGGGKVEMSLRHAELIRAALRIAEATIAVRADE